MIEVRIAMPDDVDAIVDAHVAAWRSAYRPFDEKVGWAATGTTTSWSPGDAPGLEVVEERFERPLSNAEADGVSRVGHEPFTRPGSPEHGS